MKIAERIEVDPNICHGKPRIAGTRIMVEQVLDLLAAGIPIEEIISEEYFPDLSYEDVLACVAFANQLLKGEEIHIPEVPSQT
uniref:Hypothetical conserved protein n=1 Tax=Acetithermum autotrophicum TaxID=1446466 RepID=H5SRS7_ACEAU|nr:hypothetical conserved protein [Candidatus Acetothermum autotrophicum]